MRDFIENSVETLSAVVESGRNHSFKFNEANVENITVLDVMNATNKSDAVAKLVTIWEHKNAKRALRGAGLSTLALSLAACGSDSTPFDQDDIDAATTPIAADLEAAEAAAALAAEIAAAELAAAQAQAAEDAAAAQAAIDALQEEYDALVASNAALAARTLDADGETFAAGDAADYEIIVQGTTGGADTLTATVNGSGAGALTFTFLDADDSVALEASDLSSYSSIVVSAGTVDVTAVTLADGVDVEINSGIMMTGAQFLAAGSISAGADGVITIEVSSAAQAAAIVAASDKVSGAVGFTLSLVDDAPDLTAAQVAVLEGDMQDAIDNATAAEGHYDALVARLATLDAAVDSQAAADTAGSDAIDSALAALVATRTSALALEGVAAVDEADYDTAAEANVEAAVDAAIADLEDAIELDGGFAYTGNAAIDAILVADAIADFEAAVTAAEAALTETTAALAATTLIATGDAYAAAVEASDDADAAETAATAALAAIDAALEGANADTAAAAGVIELTLVIGVDGDAADVTANIAITEVDADGVVSAISAADLVDAIAAAQVAALADDVAFVANADFDTEAEVQAVLDGLFLVDNYIAAANALDAAADAAVAAAAAETDASDAYDAAAASAAEDNDDWANAAAAQAAYDAYADDIADVATSEAALDAFNADLALLDDLNAAADAMADDLAAYTAADDAYNAGAGVDGNDLFAANASLTAALAAIEDAIADDGLNITIAGVAADFAAADNDLIDVADLADGDAIDFGGADGKDFIVAQGYTFVTVDDDSVVDMTDGDQGSASVLEIFLQEQVDGDGAVTGVALYVESHAAEGNTGVGLDVIVLNDVALADINIDSVNDILSSGEYTVA